MPGDPALVKLNDGGPATHRERVAILSAALSAHAVEMNLEG